MNADYAARHARNNPGIAIIKRRQFAMRQGLLQLEKNPTFSNALTSERLLVATVKYPDCITPHSAKSVELI